MRTYVCTTVGIFGSIIASLFGGWDTGISTLLIFMAIDYITGIIVAGVFNKSNKSDNGALQSKAGWKGLCKKGMTLLFVLIAHRLDLMVNTDYIRDTVVIGFCCNEVISIVENAGLMGLKLPAVLTRAIDVLRTKEQDHEKIGD